MSPTLPDHIYQLLLLAYPRNFRREYGSLMAQLFRDSYRQAGRRGWHKLWLPTLLDLLKTAPAEHLTAIGRSAVIQDTQLATTVRGILIGASLGVILNSLGAAGGLPSWNDTLVSTVMGGVAGSIVGSILGAMRQAQRDLDAANKWGAIVGAFQGGTAGMLLGVLIGAKLGTAMGISMGSLDVGVSIAAFVTIMLTGTLGGAWLGARFGARAGARASSRVLSRASAQLGWPWFNLSNSK